MDKIIERVLFLCRWLLVPMYLGLAGALVFLLYKFAAEFVTVATGLFQLSERRIILSVLSLIDVALVANLLLMVILSSYENFVSRIDSAIARERPAWMGHLDFSGIKLKLIGSIVAVAAIDLLGAFMNVDQFTFTELAWKVIIQFTFIISGVLYALMDRIAAQARHIEGSGGARRAARRNGKRPAGGRAAGAQH